VREVSGVICPDEANQVRMVGIPASLRPQPPQNRVRVKSDFLSRFKLIWVVQSRWKKYFAFRAPQISGTFAPSRAHTEGRFAIVTNVARDAMDAAASGA
jgi:hypothetical protein